MTIDFEDEQEETTQPIKDTKERKEFNKKMMEQKEKDHQMVKGIFHFYEVPGGTMSFMYSFYKDDPIESYDLKDGEVYEIPLGVAKHLNNNCWYPVHKFMQDERGLSSVRVGQKVKRCGFQSLDYTDELGNFEESRILSVEKV